MTSCCGLDHHTGEYTAEQRADLDRVLAFNRRMADAIDRGVDVAPVEALLDPDPLRYMWVDEGGGRLSAFLAQASDALDSAPLLHGHQRHRGRNVWSSGNAARPSVATSADGRVLYTWIEWTEDRGDRVLAMLAGAPAAGAPDETIDAPAAGAPDETAEPVAVSERHADCFRPTALFDATGRPWVFYSRSDAGEVAVWCRRYEGTAWGPEEKVSATGHPSFNQEAVGHSDGSVEVCWQGPVDHRFGTYSRRWRHGRWGEARLVSAGTGSNVWDPAIAALDGGRTAYAWSAYEDGAYQVVLRIAEADGTLGEPRPLSSGADYALHPSLAVTADGGLWCAFDVISVFGHGGSGPTRLRPTARLSEAPRVEGIRDSGHAVPAEMRPEVEASIRVVRVDGDALHEATGELAAGHDIVPGGLPRLAADPAGGLTVAYRIHRRLPLMTYYWEVAAQTLGPEGWQAPITFEGSDGTMEEPSVAPAADGALVVWQGDGRLERSLAWTEGFGGRECPRLLEHHGEVVWHGVHGTGTVRSAAVAGAGAAHAATPLAIAHSDKREESRPWAQAQRRRQDRYRTSVGGRDYALYWGDLHRHSLVSRCTAGDDPSLEDFYRYSWDVCEYDFWAVTDHSENSTAYQWWSIQKIADLLRVDGRFVPLYGFEWTSLTGHQNVIYGDVARGAPIFSAYAAGSDDPARLWQALSEHPQFPAVTIPHHPGAAMVPYDWDFHDDRFMRLVEIFQSCRGNYEDDGCFRQYSDGTLPGTFVLDGLRRGHRFGLIASSDHGHGASYVGAYAAGLDRGSIFEALAARRVFGATARDLLVDFRIDDAFMGEEAVSSGPLDIRGFVRGYTELALIDIVREGRVVHRVEPDLRLPAGWRAVAVRVEWGDAPADWSGKVTIDGGRVLQTPYWSPEIVEVGDAAVAWSATTKSFGDPYGTQRGGVEFTLLGPADAKVDVSTRKGGLSTTIAAMAGRTLDVPVEGGGRLRLQPGVGGLSGLGGHEHRLQWSDDPGEPTWYYLRAYQTDGEMAWSSPIWVDML